ncbi:MAG: LysR family transcriptional regulator [Comamonadaceae bacterium]|nr:MAG: LysR family transcriptional regulator [Comamonadaceae bacterium]
MRVFPNNVSLRQLRAFQAAARSATFAAAARQLHITQSALSESIRQLEDAVGVRLFDRTTRTVGLTSAGAAFLRDVQQALDALEQGMRHMDDLAAVRGGQVRIAAAPSVLAAIVLPALPALRRSHPGIQVQLFEEVASTITRLVREGEADFGISGWHPSVHGLDAAPLLRDHMGLLARADEPLLQAAALQASQLAPLTFIGLTDDTAISQLLQAEEYLPGSVVRPQLRVSHTLLLGEAIRLGLGVAVMPALTARHPLLADLRFQPLASPRIARRIMLLHRPRRSLSPAARVFHDAIVLQARTVAGYPGIELDEGAAPDA